MRYQHLVCTLLHAAVLLAFGPIPATAESSPPVTVSMRPYKGTRSVVAVKLNGAGPYDLMVDTGATVTVLDAALFQELGLRAEGSSQVTSSAGVTDQILSVVQEITLDSLSARNIAVVSMKSPMTATGYYGVRGILGENFLRHFDILLDNQHRKITLDVGEGLAQSLDGERLPITFPSMSHGGENLYQPMISVTVQAYGQASLLLDSGATTLVLLQWRNRLQTSVADMRLRTVNGSLPCESTKDRVSLGKGTISDFVMLRCQSETVKPRDRTGVLPTGIFKQIFISHAGSYAIINPSQRANPAQEMAAVIAVSQ
jgi:gag-polyprotein putative aspartyl protease